MWQRDAMVRRIKLTDKHSDEVVPSWFGESIGHYENGDTLVVDTIGLSTKNSYIDNFRTPHTEKLHVVERWRLVDDRKFMENTFTVEDPDTYYEPWTGVKRYRRVERRFDEQICAEGNWQLFDYGVPMAKNPDF